MKTSLVAAAAAALAAAAVALVVVKVEGPAAVEVLDGTPAPAMDLGAFSAEPPAAPVRLLYIHHSCGGQMFAPVGPEGEVARCIYTSHPNGGNLRALLEGQRYEVHEASYGSEVGDATDLFDWLPKFREKMPRILTVDRNDTLRTDGLENQVVVFKSCYPNSDFVGEGAAPGDPAGPELTLANARATMTALLPELAKKPGTLFVYMTAPPRAPRVDKERAYEVLLKVLAGKPSAAQLNARAARLARTFNDWVKAPDGWLAGYPGTNVVVFDYYDVLTNHGASNLDVYASEEGYDSHPSSEGNSRAAKEFVPFLNRAVRRAGLSGASSAARVAGGTTRSD